MLQEQVAELQANGTVDDLRSEVVRLQHHNAVLEGHASQEAKGA